jgi:hypothetical protein
MLKSGFKFLSCSLALFFFLTILAPSLAFASSADKAAKDAKQAKDSKSDKGGKPALVLLPITAQGLSEVEISINRDIVAEGLSDRYDVKYGEQTDKIIEEIFKSHSSESLECDESKCYRDVATALNTSLIGKATIILANGNYRISIVVYNVYENKAEMSRTATCEKCGPGDLEAKLKETAGMKVAEKSGGIRWYWWLLGLLGAGAAAAGGGGGSSGGGGGGTPPATTGTYTIKW